MLTNFFHNTELSLYQLSSLFQYQKTSHCWRGLLLYLNSSTLSPFRSSYLPAKQHQRCKVWHRISPLKISDTAQTASIRLTQRERLRQDNLRDTKYIFCRHASVGHPASAIQVPDRRCKTRQGSWQRQTAPCTPPSLCRLHFQNGLPEPPPPRRCRPRESIFSVRLCGNTQSSKKRSGCTL